MIITSDHINELLLQGEGLHLEMKRCKKDSLPSSLWETYSAFANSQGGVILLGVEEDKAKKSADNIGSGFSKILKAWSALKYPVPVICEHPEVNEVWLTLPLIQSNGGDNVAEDVAEDVVEDVAEENDSDLTERQRTILKLIRKSPSLAAKQMSEILSVNPRTVQRDLASLKNLGILLRQGGDKDGEWVILNKPEK